MSRMRISRRLGVVAIAAVVLQTVSPLLVSTALAAAPNHVMVRLDRQTATTATGGTICVMPFTTAGSITSITVVFPSTAGTDYIVSSTLADWATSVTATSHWPAGASAMTGISANATAANTGTKTVTWTASQGALSSSTWYCFNWTPTTGLTTSSAGAVPSTYGSVATNADTTGGQYALSIVASDQIALGATIVPPIFTMVFESNSDTFSSSTITAITTLTHSTGKYVRVSTNASSGWVLWARGSNAGTGSKQSLKSVLANKQIQSASAVASTAHTYVAGTNNGEDYGISTATAACTSGGTPTADPSYTSTGGTTLGVLADNTGNFNRIASHNAPSSVCDVTIKFEAAIGATTPAATDYTDTITVVGAGLF